MKNILLAALLLATTTALAAPPPGPPPHDRELLPPRELAEFLNLTDAQQAQAREIHDTTIRPLLEQHATREAIEAAHETARNSFAAMLTKEQRAKFEVYEEIRALRERGREGW
ncbi:MAG TPA: hypothetical protein VMU84_12700 [Thermoanaerobaculia bacterium]|nr:hypothetical protein [Thermoanaerobaculia bacterium]